jgi:DNA adenine methylase
MYIKSFINYTGSKFKILDQILPYFPTKIERLVEPFGGGCSFIQNVDAESFLFNDIQHQLIDMYMYFYTKNENDAISEVNDYINFYNLSKYNKEGYNKLKDDYNNTGNPILLFLLCRFSFNYQIRFNKYKKFNMPFGYLRSMFTDNSKLMFMDFIKEICTKKIEFSSKYFSELKINNNDFVYCDPPYDNSDTTYNLKWRKKDEINLYNWLDNLNSRKIKFVLSSVLIHKECTNFELLEFSKRYTMIDIDISYKRCNHQLKDRTCKTEEVLIFN